MHGTSGLLVSYALTAAAVLVGLVLGRANHQRLVRFPLIAIFIMIAAAILWSVISGVLQRHLGTSLTEWLGAAFLLLVSVLAGRLIATLPSS